jgi:phytoene dehydrogenase-like protein
MAATQHPRRVIIGGGHNGLVCAFYLAKAGLKVTVCEARGVVGGAAVTEEFHPGFRNSVASYTVSLLSPKVIADMGLHGHGLKILERPISNFLPISESKYMKLGGGLERTQEEFRKFAPRTPRCCRPTTPCSTRSATCCATWPPRPRPIWATACHGLLRGARQGTRLAC